MAHTEAPRASAYVPAAQSSHCSRAISAHACAPTLCLYSPGAQATHGPPSGPVNPARQRQSAAPWLPAREVAFAAHAVHAALPTVSLNEPAAHAAHGPPSGPLKPALHRQSRALPLPGGACAPSGHGAQTPAPVPFTLAADTSRRSECVSAGHVRHAVVATLENVPAAHGTHVPLVFAPT
ncbi:MAG: hypothetical protein EBR09_16420, partial [Proteobacteria bacterium]|nr:hypothetical protein [Pseudomonadota bacterium]